MEIKNPALVAIIAVLLVLIGAVGGYAFAQSQQHFQPEPPIYRELPDSGVGNRDSGYPGPDVMPPGAGESGSSE